MIAVTTTTTLRRRWPAEFEKHIGCILLFPRPSEQTTYCNENTSPNTLINAQNAVLDVVTAIVNDGNENVYLFCSNDISHQQQVIAFLLERELPYQISFHTNINDNNTSHTTSASDSGSGINTTATSTVILMICPSNDTWARDTGPTFVIETNDNNTNTNPTITTTTETTNGNDSTNCKQLIGIDWEFNAYGGQDDGCYWPCTLDQQVANNMIQQINQYYTSLSSSSSSSLHTHNHIVHHEKITSFILEGGAIHTDGQGTILTTKECLLHTNRNPQFTQNQIEDIILHTTGCSKMIWLENGLAYDDDTNGHIDNWACFVRPGHIVLAWTDDEINDPINYTNCRLSYTTLVNCTDAMNRTITVHKLYLPSPIYFSNDDDDGNNNNVNVVLDVNTSDSHSNPSNTVQRILGTRMAASYINFYIANEAIIVPQFQDPVYDNKAIQTLLGLFPNKTISPICKSRYILYGGGNIHCITQQVPQI
jgi:agmatine deiminase